MRDKDTALDVEALLSQSRFLHALARDLARDVHGAEDLVQDAYVAALESPPRDERGLRAWLATVVRRRAGRKAREADARLAREARAARAETVDDEAELRDERLHLQRRLAEAILSLDEPYRSAVVLRWLEGKSIDEVARIQGCTAVAARQRLSRAIAMLRSRLDREYEGRAWSLVALSLPDPGADTVAPLALSGGVLHMSLSMKLVGAASLIALSALLFWQFGRSSEADSVARVPTPSAELTPPSTVSSQTAPVEPLSGRAALAAAANVVPDENTLHGIVLDGDEKPVAGADIEMTWRESSGYGDLLPLARADGPAPPKKIASARSDAEGRFAIPLAPGRAFDLQASAKGLAPTLLLNRFAGEDVTVRLTRGAEIRGTVTRKPDGTPVAGARLRGFPRFDRSDMSSAPMDLFSTTTDALGRYSIPDLAPGAFMVECIPLEDPLPGWGRVELAANATFVLDFKIEAGFDVSGRVFDQATGKRIADAEVGIGWIMRRPVRTDANGEFVLRNFPSRGFREVGARAHGFGFKAIPVMDNAVGRIPKVEIGLVPSQTVKGRVLNGENKGVAGAFVAAIASGSGEGVQQADFQVTHTAADGTFALEDVRADMPHVLAVRAEGFGHVVISFPDGAVGKSRTEFGDIVLAPGVLVRGVLVDPEGNPIPNRGVDLVTLALQSPPPMSVAAIAKGGSATIADARVVAPAGVDHYAGVRSARSDDRGRFAFADVAEGEYQTKCESSDRQRPATMPVSVLRDKPLEPLKLVVDVGLSIRGRVVDASDRPLEGARVRVLRAGTSGGPSTQADAEGRFTILDVPPGPCRLRVDSWSTREGPLLAPTTSDVLQAGEKNCLVRVPLGRRLEGNVVERDGTPAKGAGVELRVAGATDLPFFVAADASGAFAFTVPTDSTCTLKAVDAGRESAELTLLDATSRVRLELPPR